jgi:hypothetical protein
LIPSKDEDKWQRALGYQKNDDCDAQRYLLVVQQVPENLDECGMKE